MQKLTGIKEIMSASNRKEASKGRDVSKCIDVNNSIAVSNSGTPVTAGLQGIKWTQEYHHHQGLIAAAEKFSKDANNRRAVNNI